MGAWQGVAMDSLKFHPGLLCLNLLCPVGGLPLKRPFQEWPALRMSSLRLYSSPLDTLRRTPMSFVNNEKECTTGRMVHSTEVYFEESSCLPECTPLLHG
jgi:hypothetical protein